MTLTTRLLVFFLTMLGAVLIGFSATLYYFADRVLYQQIEGRVNAALNTLMAAGEVEPEGVEWESKERRLDFGPSLFGEDVVWLVADEQGHLLDRARNSATDTFVAYAPEFLATPNKNPSMRVHYTGDWLVGQRGLESPVSTQLSPPARSSGEDQGRSVASLSLTVAVSLAPVRTLLRQTAVTLVVLSLTLWLAALATGRFVCHRALRPVRQMAIAAREMNGDDVALRLPKVASRDELGDLNRAFNDLLDRLQDSFTRQQRFTGHASHQLRTPVAAILGQIEVAQRRNRPVEEYQRVLALVHERATHLGEIIESLLFLARADADARLPHREPIDLNPWLVEYFSSWKDHARYADMTLERASAVDATIGGHTVLLSELLNILIDNACKFSPDKTQILIRLEVDSESAIIRVEDRGEGIAAEELPHLGDPFFRTARTRQRGIPGAGLGLSIAKRLAAAFGGILVITSQPGQGAIASIRLPLAGNQVRPHSVGTVSP